MLGTICHFAYSELENATNNFSNSNLIGLGGTSYVYRGQLKDGRIVADLKFEALMQIPSFQQRYNLNLPSFFTSKFFWLM